jgi:DNA-binding transcriptional MerR regulator
MLKIGEFSRISGVTIITLRHYDQIGLLKPVHTDDSNGYRYYSMRQLPRLNRILALKDLGFTLEQIGPVLRENIAPEQIRGMLRLKQAEIEQRVAEEQSLLGRVEARLRQIESEEYMAGYDVVLKTVDTMTIATTREVVPTIGEMATRCGAMFGALFQYVGQSGLKPSGPPFAIYHCPGYTETDIDTESAVPLPNGSNPAPATVDGIAITPQSLEGGEMAATVHHGPYTGIPNAYAAIGAWIEANGYRIVGPPREIYLVGPHEGEPVTEIQYPVQKA